MDDSSIDYKYLVNKAKKRWQLSLAKICTFPVKIVIWGINIYMLLALAFGGIALIMFIGGFFDEDRAVDPFDMLLLYIPFFCVLFVGIIFSKVPFLKKISTGLLFIICNLIIYIFPLSYGLYKLRHYQLESYLKTVEYDRCNDRYCQGFIDAYSKRHALFKVWVRNEIEYNSHVGSEWQVANFINSKPIGRDYVNIELSDGDTIEITTMVLESDVYSDHGRNTTSFKIPWSLLVDSRNVLSHKVFVMERNGRYAGCASQWECTYFIERCGEGRRSQWKSIYVPEDSIKKYFFTFKSIYNAKYDPSKKPWSEYMTYEDKEIIDRPWYPDNERRTVKPRSELPSQSKPGLGLINPKLLRTEETTSKSKEVINMASKKDDSFFLRTIHDENSRYVINN